jgi:hypothetical protein
MGKASTHPEKVQSNSNRYLHPQACGVLVKSMIRFSSGVPPMCGGALGPCQGLFLATSFTYCLAYAGELGDMEALGQGGLEGCSPFVELLDKCGSQ